MSQFTPVILSGYLNKKGDFNRHWKKRWFALRQKCLYYYEDHNAKDVKGKIPLEKATLQRKSSTKRKNAFQIHTSVKVVNKKNKGSLTNGRVFFLEALDETEKAEWCDALQDQMSVYSLDKIQDEYVVLKEAFDQLSKKIQEKENTIHCQQRDLKKKEGHIFELETNLRVRSQSSVDLRDEMKAYQDIKVKHEIAIKEKNDQIVALEKKCQEVIDQKKKAEMKTQEIRAEFEHAQGKNKVEISEYKRLLEKHSDELETTRRRMESLHCTDKLKLEKQWEVERQRLHSEMGRNVQSTKQLIAQNKESAKELIAQNEKEQIALFNEKEKDLEDLFEELAQEKDSALQEVETWQANFADLQLRFEKQKLKDQGTILRLEQTINSTMEQVEIWKLKAEAAEKERMRMVATKRSMDSSQDKRVIDTNYHQLNAQLIMKDAEIAGLKDELNEFRKRRVKKITTRSPKSPKSPRTPRSLRSKLRNPNSVKRGSSPGQTESKNIFQE